MIAEDAGGNITTQATDKATVDIFILLDERTNKYHDGEVVGRLQFLTGLQPNSPYPVEQELSLDNLMNAEPIVVGKVTKSACIITRIPHNVRRLFKDKFIPPGTMFDCTFPGNDITKLQITGIHEDREASVILDNKLNEHNL